MNDIRVKKGDLVAKLEENRAAHRALVEKAWVGYRVKAVEQIDAALARVRSGSRDAVYIALQIPQDHTSDYDRVLSMMKMAVEDEIVLCEQDFSTYVLDQWEWQRQSTMTNTAYAMAAPLS